eukprot:jgi/Chlat1/2980/Chrsp2S04647
MAATAAAAAAAPAVSWLVCGYVAGSVPGREEARAGAGTGAEGPGSLRYHVPVPVPVPAAASSAGGGYGFALFVSGEGRLYGWGELPQHSEDTSSTSSTFTSHTQSGLCELPIHQSSSHDDRVKVAAAGWAHVVACSGSSNAYTSLFPLTKVPFNPSVKVVSVAAGDRHSLALTDDGQIYAWGDNADSQLGLDKAAVAHAGASSCSEPQRVPAVWSEAAWPHDRAPRGICTHLDGAYMARQVTGYQTMRANQHWLLPLTACALPPCPPVFGILLVSLVTAPATVSGGTSLGKSGADSDRARHDHNVLPCLLESLDSLQRISCGARHTVAITTNGSAFSWGWNEYGQLGLGDCEQRSTPTRVSLCSDDAEPTAAGATVVTDSGANRLLCIDAQCGWWSTSFAVTAARSTNAACNA